MIYFVCPSCGEDLEAEDSIRGARMKCPACAKDLEVPQLSVKAPTRPVALQERREPPAGSGPAPGARFIMAVLAAGAVGLLVLSGLGYVLNRKVREARVGRSACVVCAGLKNVACAQCNRAKTVSCKECGSTGRRKNWRDEEETCFVCNGTGIRTCQVCGGAGEYSCAACYGTGREGAEPPPTFDFK